MLEEYKQIALEESGYKPTNKDLFIVLCYFIVLFPFSLLIDFIGYIMDKYLEVLAYYCSYKGER